MTLKKGLAQPYWQTILTALYDNSNDYNLTMTEISNTLNMQWSQVYLIIHKLEEYNFITRTIQGRRKYISLTDKGNYAGRILSDLNKVMKGDNK